MRFNIGGVKFGHVPGTKPSPTEQSRLDGAAQAGRVARPAVGGPAHGNAPPLQQRPPERQNALRPPDTGAHQFPAPRLTQAFIRLPGSQKALPPQASTRSTLAQPDPPGRVADDQYSEHQSQNVQWSQAFIRLPNSQQVSLPQVPTDPQFGLREPPGRVAEEPRPQGGQLYLRQHLNPIALRRYDDLNLPVTGDTFPTFTDAEVTRKPAKLGSGAFNTVFSVQLRGAHGAPVEGVFKPLRSSERGWVAEKTGIPRHNPQLAMRNIATEAYAKTLGFNVIADTKVALLTAPGSGAIPAGLQLGLLMERAAGQTAHDTDAAVMARPDVAREVTKLQLLDHLTGQGDRHSSNYFVHVDANNQAKVTGIDNDQCFGEKATHPESTHYANVSERKGFRGTRLPPVVDHDMAIAISSLQPSDLQAMLGDKLTPSEVDAAVQRLEGVKKHIVKLDKQGFVVSPEEWAHPDVQQRLFPDNSYAERDSSDGKRRSAPARAQAQW